MNNAEVVRSFFLNIGLEKGVIGRVAVDQVTGDLSDPREKFLGPNGIKLNRLKIKSIFIHYCIYYTILVILSIIIKIHYLMMD